MKHIVVINGSGGSGKDTFVEFVGKYTKVFNFSSVDIIKDAARVLGWDGRKFDKDRKFLSDLKALAISYNDAPLQSVLRAVSQFNNDENELMFVHIREISEIKKFLNAMADSAMKVQTLLVTNPNVDVITSNMSDSGVFNYDYSMTIVNDGTLEDLDKKAEDFVKNLF